MLPKQIYQEILDVIKKHGEVLKNDRSLPDLSLLQDRIRTCEILEEFKICLPLHRICSSDNIHLTDYTRILLMGKDHGRTVSWLDEGQVQPENEHLYYVSFPCGAYTIGNSRQDCYPTKTFNKMFEELRSFGPKYSDSHNHILYFTSEKAWMVEAELPEIIERHAGMVAEEMREAKREKLQAELDALEVER